MKVVARESGARQNTIQEAAKCAARPQPRPCLPPKIKPPFIKFGTTSMHFALLNTSSGIPLSGVAMMACRTSTDDYNRASVSSRAEPAQAQVPTRAMNLINTTDIYLFHELFLSELWN
jgi:cytochrome b561